MVKAAGILLVHQRIQTKIHHLNGCYCVMLGVRNGAQPKVMEAGGPLNNVPVARSQKNRYCHLQLLPFHYAMQHALPDGRDKEVVYLLGLSINVIFVSAKNMMRIRGNDCGGAATLLFENSGSYKMLLCDQLVATGRRIAGLVRLRPASTSRTGTSL